MTKKILLSLALLPALYLGGRALVRFLASDETKIRWLVADMEEAYNEGRPGSCVAPLAESWRHEGFGLDRELLRGALFQASLERDKTTHELLSRVAVDEDAARVTVDGERATLEADVSFARLRRGAWEEAWSIHVEAELREGEDGWEVVKSRHRDVEGTHLGR